MNFDFEPVDPHRTGLSPEAIAVAEGWMAANTKTQHMVLTLINVEMERLLPMLAPFYAAASRPDQIRADRIAERVTHAIQNGKVPRGKRSKPRGAA